MLNRLYSFVPQQVRMGAAVLTLLAVSAAVLPRPARAETTMVVDDDGRATATDCNANQVALSSVQAAVTAAAAGSTILICPGTYAEQVVIRTSRLTLRGTGGGLAVLQPTAFPVAPGSPGAGSPRKAILLIDGATGITVARLTIDGSAADAGATNFSTCGAVGFTLGIYYRNGAGAVDATHVTNIRSAARCSAGIMAESGAGGTASLTVTGTTVDHYGMRGVVCVEPTTACTIIGNTLQGRGPVADQIQAGMTIRVGASATIAGNVIRDHVFIPRQGAATAATGILLFAADPSTNPHLSRDNTFINNDLDVQRFATTEPFF